MNVRILPLAIVIILSACKREKADGSHQQDRAIDALVKLDAPLGVTQPGDWLDVHSEPGQTFSQYIQSKPVSPSVTRNRIYLQPLGTFSSAESNLVTFTANYLQLFFSLETIVLPVVSDTIVPPAARRNSDDHQQLQTGFIMNYLQHEIPEDGIVIMAITPFDLYPSDDFNYVFGQARTKNRVGVSSFNRFVDEPLDSTNYQLCLSRLIKTSSHEIGHMFTCQHCTHAICVMNGSNSLWESDSRPNRLCSECLRKLQWNLKFDVTARAEKMRDFFAEHSLKEDFELAVRDLTLLQKTHQSNSN